MNSVYGTGYRDHLLKKTRIEAKNYITNTIVALPEEILDDTSGLGPDASSINQHEGNDDIVRVDEESYDQINQCIRKMDEINLALSPENPWIELFLQYDEEYGLTRQYLRLFADHVYIRRFEEIRFVFREAEWKERVIKYLQEAQQWQG